MAVHQQLKGIHSVVVHSVVPIACVCSKWSVRVCLLLAVHTAAELKQLANDDDEMNT